MFNLCNVLNFSLDMLCVETLESLYYFYRFTHDRRYQDMAWEIFDAIHTYCRANSGFSGVADVDSFYPRWDDRQER